MIVFSEEDLQKFEKQFEEELYYTPPKNLDKLSEDMEGGELDLPELLRGNSKCFRVSKIEDKSDEVEPIKKTVIISLPSDEDLQPTSAQINTRNLLFKYFLKNDHPVYVWRSENDIVEVNSLDEITEALKQPVKPAPREHVFRHASNISGADRTLVIDNARVYEFVVPFINSDRYIQLYAQAPNVYESLEKITKLSSKDFSHIPLETLEKIAPLLQHDMREEITIDFVYGLPKDYDLDELASYFRWILKTFTHIKKLNIINVPPPKISKTCNTTRIRKPLWH